MILSMTGFGRGSAEAPGVRVAVEVRGLNNRFADLRLRLPSELSSEEAGVRRRVLRRVQRGRLEMTVDLERSADFDAGISLNRPLLKAVADAARIVREEYGFEGEMDVAAVLAIPDVLRRPRGGPETDDAVRDALHRAVDAAMDALDEERKREGEDLRKEISARFSRIEALVGELRGSAAGLPEILRRKLVERLESLAGGVALDPARVAQEAVYLADRCDVTEELVRLEGHVRQAISLVAEPDGEPVGKRLDFLLQEIHRETNTVNAKAGDLEVSRGALALKSEAEKIREQIQNVE